MGDHAHAKFSVKLLVGPALQAAARGAVQGHDWKPARVTPHRKRQGAPALRLKSPQRLAHRSEHTPARGNASGESTLVDVPVRPHRRGSLRRAGGVHLAAKAAAARPCPSPWETSDKG